MSKDTYLAVVRVTDAANEEMELVVVVYAGHFAGFCNEELGC